MSGPNANPTRPTIQRAPVESKAFRLGHPCACTACIGGLLGDSEEGCLIPLTSTDSWG